MDKKEALKQINAGKDEEDNNYFSLAEADEKLKADKEVVLAAVKQDGYAFQYADKKLRADKEIVLEAVKNTGSAIRFVDDSFKKDREIVLAAVKQEGLALQYVDKKLRADKEIVLAALKQDAYAFRFADKKLRADKKIVMAKTKSQIKNFKKLEQEAHSGTNDSGYYNDDPEYNYCLGRFAEDLCYAGYKKWARKIYKIVEGLFKGGEIDTVSVFYCAFASDVALNLGDKKWARKIYKEAEKDDDIERRELADSIITSLGDKEWGRKIFEEIIIPSEYAITRPNSNLYTKTARDIYEILVDKKWAKEVYKKAEEKAENFTDLRYLAEELCKIMKDKNWAKKVYKKAEEKSKDKYKSEFDELTESIRENLGDKEWAKKIKES